MRFPVFHALLSCGILSLFFSLAPLGAQPAQPPGLVLSRHAQGTAAIDALGTHLPAVARAYGMEPERLATLFRLQPSLGIDRFGALLFLCGDMAVPANAQVSGGTTTSVSLQNATSSDVSDALRLNSLPGAPRVIYLDFDGHVTSGTPWNSTFNGGHDIVSAPFDLDGNPSSFNHDELAFIKRVWQRVAEDFAPFRVNVTTQDPGLEALRKTSSGDDAFGVRVVISPTSWYGGGGVAYVGSFSWSSDTPCFVFTSALSNWEKAIAECTSHEAGHTLGLKHSGASGTEYYAGHGNWAPIMGNSYYKAVTHWSRGEYAGASNTDDQLAVMQTQGAPLLGDDHGNTLSTATLLTGTDVATGGTIETRADVDVFRFDIPAGAVSLTIRGFAPETNLNLKADLLDSAGRILVSRAATTTGTKIETSLAAGTYYLRLDGVGEGDPASTGYSDYGSLGNYVILGTLPGGTTSSQAPVAHVSASPTSGTAPLYVQFTGQNSTDADGTIVSYFWNFGNGATSAAMNPAYTYQSTGTFTATLTVTDNDGLTGSASTVISVSSSSTSTSAPFFTLHPLSTTAAPLSTVTLTAAASGSPEPTYRWYRDGVTYSSWTGSSLTLYDLTDNDAGSYVCVATNSAGSATSNAATVTVSASTTTTSNTAPIFTQHPASVTAAPLSTVTLTAAASGSPEPTYRWYRDGVTYSSWTGSSLTLYGLTDNDAGSYVCVATNSAGSATSNAATVTVGTSTTSGNTAPVAVASASTASGSAPLAVAFSSAGSYDPDGSISACRWDFGDGTSSPAAFPSKTFNTPGTYTVRLTVTDNAGATGSATLSIAVFGDWSSDYDVRRFTLSSSKAPNGTTVAATVLVRDRYDRPVPNASVTLTCSGLLSGTKTGTTDANGQLVLALGRTKKSGTVTATITSVVGANGTKFDDTIYAEPLTRTIMIQ
jgi:PKD repeat protein